MKGTSRVTGGKGEGTKAKEKEKYEEGENSAQMQIQKRCEDGKMMTMLIMMIDISAVGHNASRSSKTGRKEVNRQKGLLAVLPIH